LRNLRNGDVVDIDLLPADQVEQQVEGALILFQVKMQRRRHCLQNSRESDSALWPEPSGQSPHPTLVHDRF
jgi:hypothetical protein